MRITGIPVASDVEVRLGKGAYAAGNDRKARMYPCLDRAEIGYIEKERIYGYVEEGEGAYGRMAEECGVL